jgi:tetratricopeptide (TPR) repeat protein
MTPTEKHLSIALVAAIVVAGAGLAQTTETPEQILKQVNARLLAWDTAGARQLFDTLPAAGTPAAKIAAGRLLSQESRLDESVAQLSAAVAAASADPSPAIYLGETYRLADRPEDARQAFEMAAQRATSGLEPAPDNVRLLVALGVARQKLRQLPEAITALDRARELAPGNVEATYQLGICHAMARNWSQAVDTLTQALSQNSEIAYAYYFRALSAEKVDRKDLLINDLKRFLALAPNAPDAARAKRLLAAIQG